MISFNEAPGVNWNTELPDDLDNQGDGLEGMSPDASRSFVLYGSPLKSCKLLGAIVSYLRSFGSDRKSPLKSGKVTYFFRLWILPVSLSVVVKDHH